MGWKYLPIWLVLAWATVGAAPSTQPATRPVPATRPAESTLFHSGTYGFSIKFPSDLEIQEPAGGCVVQAAEVVSADQPPKTAEIITVSVVPSPPAATLEAHYVQTARDLNKTLELFESQAFGYARIAGYPAFRLEYIHRIRTDHHRVRLVGILIKPSFFLLSCSAREGEFDRLHDRFETVISSFRLAAPTSRPTSAPGHQP